MYVLPVTRLERRIIMDRLQLIDELADALDVDADAVEHAVNEIIRRSDGRTFRFNPGLEAAIIKDCVEGSTYVAQLESAVAEFEASHSTLRRAERALASLADKLASILGEPVHVPA